MHPEDDWSLSILVEISLRIWVLCLLIGAVSGWYSVARGLAAV